MRRFVAHLRLGTLETRQPDIRLEQEGTRRGKCLIGPVPDKMPQLRHCHLIHRNFTRVQVGFES